MYLLLSRHLSLFCSSENLSEEVHHNSKRTTQSPTTLNSSDGFWTHVLEAFLIQLPDQQLLLGLLVLICSIVEYYRSSPGGNDNLWHAADVACFSMFSHDAAVLAPRGFLHENKKLAAARVWLMIVVFVLWATIGYYILHPSRPYHKTKIV